MNSGALGPFAPGKGGSGHRRDIMTSPKVGILMGSDSDWPVLEGAHQALEEFRVAHEIRVVSAHRTPEDMTAYARSAASRGLRVLIAGAGGAAHLPGMIAASTTLPVIGVPVPSRHLSGWDSLLSIVQMPSGVPVATVAIGGARNAALLAVSILALTDADLAGRLQAFRSAMAEESRAKDRRLGETVARPLED